MAKKNDNTLLYVGLGAVALYLLSKNNESNSISGIKKYKYFLVLQGNYGYGWDDLEDFETNSQGIIINDDDRKELKRLKIEYKIAHPSVSLRVISRKEKI